jgi:anaerobic dimethyl sulfoxide reductase subunit C (anchor subunit)
MKEQPLVIFTIMSQTAVGAFLAWALFSRGGLYSGGGLNVDHLALPHLILVMMMILISLLVSILHLGNPFNAWLSVKNLRHSWLSREIFLALLYTLSLGLFIFIRLYDLGAPLLRAGLVGLTAILGLALIYSMGRVYMVRTIDAWNTWLTPASFFVTAFLLGILLFGAVLVIQVTGMNFKQVIAAEGWFRAIVGVLMFLVLVQYILIPLSITRLPLQGKQTWPGWPLGKIYIVRLAPLFLGSLLAGVIYTSTTQYDLVGALAASLAFGLVLFSELFGRQLFYASRQNILL